MQLDIADACAICVNFLREMGQPIDEKARQSFLLRESDLRTTPQSAGLTDKSSDLVILSEPIKPQNSSSSSGGGSNRSKPIGLGNVHHGNSLISSSRPPRGNQDIPVDGDVDNLLEMEEEMAAEEEDIDLEFVLQHETSAAENSLSKDVKVQGVMDLTQEANDNLKQNVQDDGQEREDVDATWDDLYDYVDLADEIAGDGDGGPASEDEEDRPPDKKRTRP